MNQSIPLIFGKHTMTTNEMFLNARRVYREQSISIHNVQFRATIMALSSIHTADGLPQDKYKAIEMFKKSIEV